MQPQDGALVFCSLTSTSILNISNMMGSRRTLLCCSLHYSVADRTSFPHEYSTCTPTKPRLHSLGFSTTFYILYISPGPLPIKIRVSCSLIHRHNRPEASADPPTFDKLAHFAATGIFRTFELTKSGGLLETLHRRNGFYRPLD